MYIWVCLRVCVCVCVRSYFSSIVFLLSSCNLYTQLAMHKAILQAILLSPPLWEAISRCVTRSTDGKGSHITVCVNAYVTRMLPTSLCGMTHTDCGQHIGWCAAFYGPIRVRSRCSCPETKACSSSRGTAAHCLEVGTGLKRAVSFRLWPTYPLY